MKKKGKYQMVIYLRCLNVSVEGKGFAVLWSIANVYIVNRIE